MTENDDSPRGAGGDPAEHDEHGPTADSDGPRGADGTVDPDGRVDPSGRPAADDEFVAGDPGEVATEADADTAPPAVDRPDPTDRDDREVAVVPKRTYCQRCEYFTAPPDVGCTREDTEIVELVDVDRFRVVGCPLVAERRRLFEAGD